MLGDIAQDECSTTHAALQDTYAIADGRRRAHQERQGEAGRTRRKREDGDGVKRGRLQELEDEAMREEDPKKLEELFKLYMNDYEADKETKRTRARRWRSADGGW